MRVVILPLVALAMILGLLYVLQQQLAPETTGLGPGGADVLVLHDALTQVDSPSEMVSAMSLVQLLAHFDVDITVESVENYEKGRLRKFDYVFYVGTKSGQPLPSVFIDDVYNTDKPIFWINENLDRIGKRHSMDKYGFEWERSSDDYATNEVVYKDTRLAKVSLQTFGVRQTRKSVSEVIAEAKYVSNPVKEAQSGFELSAYDALQMVRAMAAKSPSDMETLSASPLGMALPEGLPTLPEGMANPDKAPDVAKLPGTTAEQDEALLRPPPPPMPEPPPAITIPWIIKGANLWYVSSDALAYAVEGGAYLAFCDVLHDFLEVKHVKEHPAFLRLEDIHAKRDPESLKRTADLLFTKKVPFAFTLTPVYVNPETDEISYLSDDEKFSETVRYLVSKGGVPILHGYTHQHSGETAVDFEFWSREDGRSLFGDDRTAVASRLVRGLSEAHMAGIYPIAWTTPHYAAGQTDYDEMANFFTTVVERRMPVDLFGSDQFFPYVIKQDMHRQIIIPETLGYINPSAGRDPQALIDDAKRTLVVRDGWASFFFHTFLDLELLSETIDGIRAEGYEFVSLADFNNKVTTRDRVTVTGTSDVKISFNGQYKHEMVINEFGEPIDHNYSLGTVTGDVQKYVSLRPREVQVIEGVYRRPPFTLRNLYLFRPTISGVTNPVALVLLFVGMLTMLAFLVIWLFLVTRTTYSGAKQLVAERRGEDVG
ncbi:MAG: polysaccharide deacetylase family protein [Deltaproteobacteria bacterium]|nr:polysaccharide deacetylase family protein [Deltaproteobacteria bacterium]